MSTSHIHNAICGNWNEVVYAFIDLISFSCARNYIPPCASSPIIHEMVRLYEHYKYISFILYLGPCIIYTINAAHTESA